MDLMSLAGGCPEWSWRVAVSGCASLDEVLALLKESGWNRYHPLS
jgi:hypothetical protein